MIKMRSIVTLIFLFITLLPGLLGQEDPYIIRRESYQPGPSSLNFSPDGTLLLAGFMDGSFRLLDPDTFQASLEVENAHQKAITAMDMPPKMEARSNSGTAPESILVISRAMPPRSGTWISATTGNMPSPRLSTRHLSSGMSTTG
jgi:WD40 repeat protein